MSHSLNAAAVLDQEFLDLRAELLQAAARLDRLDRASDASLDDPRINAIRRALQVLSGNEAGRAEKIQLVFSRSYMPDWRKELNLNAKG
jgi:hypothetical protein